MTIGLLVAQCAAFADTGFLDRSVTVGNKTYRYQVYVPADHSAKKTWPVVVNLHGNGAQGPDGLLPTARGMADYIRLNRSRFPSLAVFPQAVDTQIGESLLQERLMARLSAVFGAVALFLAVVGLYGIVSYTVASRRAKIGVRVALGASGARIVRAILGDISRTMAVGLVAGAALALAGGRGLASLVYGVSATDGMTLSAAAVVLAGAVLLAAMWPARRAAAIDPVEALRVT